MSTCCHPKFPDDSNTPEPDKKSEPHTKHNSCHDNHKNHNNHDNHGCHDNQRKWYQNPLFIAAIIATGSVWGLDYIAPSAGSVTYFLTLLKELGGPLLLGLVLGGIIDSLIPKAYIQQILAKKKKRTLVYSVLLGLLFSVCSHGILAIAMQLYKKGASISSVVTFLLASPWTSLPITFMLIGFFGFKSLLIIGAAILISLTTGYVFQQLEKAGKLERSPHQTEMKNGDQPILKDMITRLRAVQVSKQWLRHTGAHILSGTWSLTQMVLWWVMIGLVASVWIHALIPTEMIAHYFGSSLLGMSLTLLSATIIEVCSEGSAPIAFELYTHTKALGNVFVFLMAGVATDYTEIGLLWSNIGRKTALLVPAISVIQILFVGYFFNLLFS